MLKADNTKTAADKSLRPPPANTASGAHLCADYVYSRNVKIRPGHFNHTSLPTVLSSQIYLRKKFKTPLIER